MRRLLKQSKRLVILAFASVMALTVVGAPASVMAQEVAATKRQKMFQAASKEFNVPEKILLAVAYNQTRFENYDGKPSVAGGYGLMHLTAEAESDDGRGNPLKPLPKRTNTVREYTLDKAAALIGASVETLKHDDRQNVRGAAALLSHYGKQLNAGKFPLALGDWYGAVARFGSMHDEKGAIDFADAVYATIQKGASLKTSDGQAITLSSESVQTKQEQVKLLGLPTKANPQNDTQTECPATIVCKFVPARFAQNNPNDPADYGNMDIADRPNDTKIKYIVIHDTEGSYQSAIDWFRDPISYVAAHYVIRSSDGEVTQMIKTKDIGWQAGNWYMNMHSIGVEHEGFAAQGGAWYTEIMYQTSAKLVRYLADKYDIPLDRQHIVGHDQYHGLTPARAKRMHYDPGPFWDWNHYMDLLHGRDNVQSADMSNGFYGNVIKISPRFATNQPLVTECDKLGACKELPKQGANFVYLRTAPQHDAPLLTDAGLHPDGEPGTTEISDWSAKATTGQKFVVAERQGDWTAIWFGGQKGWFYNPASWQNRTALPSWSRRVTPKASKTTIPVYGRPVPERSAFNNGVPAFDPVPLQYVIKAGQSYPAYDRKAINDYFHVLTFDRSTPGDGLMVIGNEKYIPIEYNHRQAFVKASDVDLSWF